MPSDKNYERLLDLNELHQSKQFVGQGIETDEPKNIYFDSSMDIDPDCDISTTGPRFQRNLTEVIPAQTRFFRALGRSINKLMDIKRIPSA